MSKRAEILEGLRNAMKKYNGMEPSEVTEEKFFTNVPDGRDEHNIFNADYKGIDVDHPDFNKFLGYDDVDMSRLMFFIEAEFSCTLSDENFLPRMSEMEERKVLWRFRPVSELIDYLEQEDVLAKKS